MMNPPIPQWLIGEVQAALHPGNDSSDLEHDALYALAEWCAILEDYDLDSDADA